MQMHHLRPLCCAHVCCVLRAQTYVGQLFADNPKERDTWVGAISSVALLGATIGAFVLMPFSAGNGANAFNAIWLSIGSPRALARGPKA